LTRHNFVIELANFAGQRPTMAEAVRPYSKMVKDTKLKFIRHCEALLMSFCVLARLWQSHDAEYFFDSGDSHVMANVQGLANCE
jgi:hypothetical protein